MTGVRMSPQARAWAVSELASSTAAAKNSANSNSRFAETQGWTAEAYAAALAAEPLLDALITAESFISGFEGDELQESIDDLLTTIRTAIGNQS